MGDISKFKRFAKKKAPNVATNNNVWLYTRVSSKNQKDNYSLEYQKDEAQKFAKSKGYIITEEFGNNNESASNDFTRKEFTDLMAKVNKSKVKPYAIMVYVMNRFSRTGGSAIGIANELVSKTGVHLIEVCSGQDTSTDDGKLEIWSKLIEAKRQNMDRLKHTVPGMQRFIQSGNYLGNAPMGYDHYGPRVTDFSKRTIEQKIVLNEDGKKLKLAWEWKAEGMADFEIINKLTLLGLKVRKQKLSAMWRKPFYCGIQNNSLLEGDCVKGNWEPMVSEELFWKVQSIIDRNNQGYTIDKEVYERPLVGLLYCSVCRKKLTSYENKKKKLHYYKCQYCKGVSINATTPHKHPTHLGANDMFIALLDSYGFKPELEKLFALQMKKLLLGFASSNKHEEALYKKQLTELNQKKEKLEERFAYGEIESKIFQKFDSKIDEEISCLRKKYDVPELDVSNLETNLNKALDFTHNVSKYWYSSETSIKKRIQNLIFPEGLLLDAKNRQYLTRKTNAIFAKKRALIGDEECIKKEIPTKNGEDFSLVAGTGLEPVAFGL